MTAETIRAAFWFFGCVGPLLGGLAFTLLYVCGCGGKKRKAK